MVLLKEPLFFQSVMEEPMEKVRNWRWFQRIQPHERSRLDSVRSDPCQVHGYVPVGHHTDGKGDFSEEIQTRIDGLIRENTAEGYAKDKTS